eukprot:XP_011681453.1 PREDICTED: uncharacterized protein LOC105446391 isoform X2 [Strongylocentrotus purpuratus]
MAGSGEQLSRPGTLTSNDRPVTQTNPTNPASTEDMAGSGEQFSRPGTLTSNEGVTQPNPTNKALTVRTEFTDLECLDLADLICPDNDFQRLGHYLGFNAPALSRYRRENTGGGCHGVYKMLVDWKKRFLNHEQRENLANALENAGLKALASKVRHGQRLKSFSGPPPDFSSQSCMPSASNFSQPNNPPRSLRSDEPTTRPEVSLGQNTTLPRNTEPSPGNDVQDIELYKLSRQLSSNSYQRLGLSLGFSFDQLDAFKTKSCNDIPNAGLDMLTNFKSQVGHIRKDDFKTFLTTKANLPVPSLVNFC